MSTSAPQTTEAVVVEFQSIAVEPNRRVAGTISAHSGKRLVLSMPEELGAASPIRVQGKHFLFLGHVLESTPGVDGNWSVHVSVKSKFMIF